MFNLTRQERQVILFFLAIALLGLGIDFTRKKFTHLKYIADFSQDIGKIELNRADKELLTSVSGIGEKLVQRIIEYRNQQGVFQSIEELKNIKGINEAKYGKIKDSFLINK